MSEPVRKNVSPFRWIRENLTRSEKTAVFILTAALTWFASSEIIRGIRKPSPAGSEPDLYDQLCSSLPDHGFYSARLLQKDKRTFFPDPFDAAVYAADCIRPSRPFSAGEIDVSETGWIFFPRDYYTTLNINTATFRQLQDLPGIGPRTARRIIAYRRRYSGFIKPSGLQKVKGIGPRTYRALKNRIRVH